MKVITAVAEMVGCDPASCAMKVYPGVIIDALPVTVIDIVGFDIGLDTLARVDIDIWPASMIALEFSC